MKIASSQRQVRVIVACVAGVLKGKGKGVLGKGVLGARETPFPFPFQTPATFKRLPRRLELQRVRLPGGRHSKAQYCFLSMSHYVVCHPASWQMRKEGRKVVYSMFTLMISLTQDVMPRVVHSFTSGKKGVTKPHLTADSARPYLPNGVLLSQLVRKQNFLISWLLRSS